MPLTVELPDDVAAALAAEAAESGVSPSDYLVRLLAARRVAPAGTPPPFDRGQAERFMRLAIELARRGVEAGDGGPFGAVVVRDGTVVGEGWNRVVGGNDPTAHGEVVAIRDACARAGDFSLAGCELYTTGEPCPMCLGAIHWARLDRVFYGFSCEDAAAAGFDDRFIYDEFAEPPDRRKIPEAQVLGAEARELLGRFAADPKRVRY
jgi:tRNA(Arg) A34 adenosine deaminase TadA